MTRPAAAVRRVEHGLEDFPMIFLFDFTGQERQGFLTMGRGFVEVDVPEPLTLLAIDNTGRRFTAILWPATAPLLWEGDQA